MAQPTKLRYGHRAEDPIEIVSLRLAVIGTTRKPKLLDAPATGSMSAALTETRQSYIAGAWLEANVYDRMKLARGAQFEGPALIEEPSASTVVPPGWRVSTGPLGVLYLEKTERSA